MKIRQEILIYIFLGNALLIQFLDHRQPTVKVAAKIVRDLCILYRSLIKFMIFRTPDNTSLMAATRMP